MPQGRDDAVIFKGSDADPHVLVVDGLKETAQVLRAVFEARGHQVDRVRGYELSGPSRGPSVLVVYDDGNDEVRRSRYGSTPRVVIASRTEPEHSPRETNTDERRLTHPFQYPELIHAVEMLLADAVPARAAA